MPGKKAKGLAQIIAAAGVGFGMYELYDQIPLIQQYVSNIVEFSEYQLARSVEQAGPTGFPMLALRSISVIIYSSIATSAAAADVSLAYFGIKNLFKQN